MGKIHQNTLKRGITEKPFHSVLLTKIINFNFLIFSSLLTSYKPDICVVETERDIYLLIRFSDIS